ncbi:DUF4861 family protein [Sphingobacterium mizutaii]|uniref:DUF4861 family protein n=1 Tax=Sphingobacterium mizutaii TaxID=1010 RepID=UPI0028A7E085|nr:DUF4861 family protein [Sphingobacterium mizutaii]
MKRILLTCLIIVNCLAFCQAQYIQVKNPSKYARKELISIPFQNFKEHFKVDTVFTIRDENNQLIPFQLEKLGTAIPVNVLIQVELPAQSTIKYKLEKEPGNRIEPMTFARYVPERLDDFAWENDVVAFRLYGKALEGRKDDGQGMDYWAKRTDKLIVNKWYKVENYHQDTGEGMDYYTVGQTLGAGDVALLSNNGLHYTKHYRRYQILDNGPLRSTFKLEYDPEELDEQEVKLTKIISLDAGSNFNKIVLQVQNKMANSTAIAIGVARRKEDQPKLAVEPKNETLAYWEPEIAKNGQTGIAVIIPKKKVSIDANRPEQFLLTSQAMNGQDFVYYNGAVWNRAGKVSSAEEWNKAVEQEHEKIKKPLKWVLK